MVMNPLPPCTKMSVHIRCYLMDHPELSKAEVSRMMAAAQVLDTGMLPERSFVVLDMPPMRVVQQRYIQFVEQYELTKNDVARRLGMDPSTLRRRRNGRPRKRRSEGDRASSTLVSPGAQGARAKSASLKK